MDIDPVHSEEDYKSTPKEISALIPTLILARPRVTAWTSLPRWCRPHTNFNKFRTFGTVNWRGVGEMRSIQHAGVERLP